MENKAVDKFNFVQMLLSHQAYDFPLEGAVGRGLPLAYDVVVLKRIEQIRLMHAPDSMLAAKRLFSAMEFPVGEPPAKWLRAWVPDGLKSHGLNCADVAPDTGGTIIYSDDQGTTFAVKWDSGLTTVHNIADFASNLICIGRHQTLEEYLSQEPLNDN